MEEKIEIKEAKTLPGEVKAKTPWWKKINKEFFKSKQFLYWVVIPVVLLGLLIFGLIQQGFVGDWINYFKRADITVIITSPDNKPIDSVQVIIGDKNSTTDANGQVSISDLVAGKKTMSLRRTGFVSSDQEVTLKKGHNDLGTYIMDEIAATKITATTKIVDYISGAAINNATVTLGDLKPTQNSSGDTLTFTQVPVGEYTLAVIRTGYNSYSAKIIITAKTTTLGTVMLVRTGRVVYESNSDKGLRGLFTVNLDGSDKKALISRVGDFEDYSPALSPDQTKVFFFSTRDGVKQDNSTNYKEALYLINIDGSNLVKISDNAEGYNAKWAPNSKFVTYVSPYTQADGYKLRIYNVVNKTITALDDYIKVDSGTVSISTDGKLVVFSGYVKGASTSSGLFYGNVDGTSIKTIDNLSVNSVEFTSENKIRYSYYDSPSSSMKYYEYDPSANTKTAITSPAIDKVAATVSPNGKYRAYVSTRDGRTNLFVSKADGTEEIQLTTLNKVTGSILWSLDSSYIIFDYGTYGESARYLVDAAGQANAKKIIDINASSWY